MSQINVGLFFFIACLENMYECPQPNENSENNKGVEEKSLDLDSFFSTLFGLTLHFGIYLMLRRN